MNISIILGSPKKGESTSQILTKYLMYLLQKENAEVLKVDSIAFKPEQITKAVNSDVLVFVFPLYLDSIPSHILRFMAELEKHSFNKETVVYCVINNGFYEGKQNHIAVEQMKNWSKKVNVIWGQAMGVGAGEMIPFIKDVPLGHGPNKNMGTALKNLSLNIINKNTGTDMYVSPNWPRLLWKIQASLFVWYPRAKKNGLSKKDLFEKASI